MELLKVQTCGIPVDSWESSSPLKLYVVHAAVSVHHSCSQTDEKPW